MKHTEFYFMTQNIITLGMLVLLAVVIVGTIIYVIGKSIFNKLFRKDCAKCKYHYLRSTPWWYNCEKRNDIKDWKGGNILEHYEKCKDFEKGDSE